MHRARVRAALLLALATLLAVAACAPTEFPNQTDDGGRSGYISGDGSVTTWVGDQRTEPVKLAGETFAGDQVDLADWRGDVVVLNFWYAACPPCRAEAPALREVATETAADGVKFLGVNSTDDAGTAEAFERTFEVPYGSLADKQSRAIAALQGRVALQAVPTTVVLDRQGRVAARVLGQVDASTLRALIGDVLAEGQ